MNKYFFFFFYYIFLLFETGNSVLMKKGKEKMGKLINNERQRLSAIKIISELPCKLL
jgi:hypothetical protein